MSALLSDSPVDLEGFPLSDPEWLSGVWRGWRNGIMTGVRIRLPYVFQAALYAIWFGDEASKRKLRFVIKQMFWHGRNLGLYVCVYKTICYALRHLGVRGGLESWIAGFIGGFWAFGDSEGVSGAVNNQIVLYLFARGIEGQLRGLVHLHKWLPESCDIHSPIGFRVFAGFSLALILYMTDYENSVLRSSFNKVMHNLYYESNAGPLMPPSNFAPFVWIVMTSYLSFYFGKLSLDNILSVIDPKT